MEKGSFNGIRTSHLGFGCSLLTRNNSVQAAIENLQTAFDAGISHFDVARLYGFGEAETILGKFAKGKRHEITITTKTGLRGKQLPLWALPLINRVRSVLKSKQSSIANNSVIGAPETSVFSPSLILCDLHTSLNKIGTDFVDFYLLHEAKITQANQEDIIATLQQCKDAGKIKMFGIASNSQSIRNEYQNLNKAYQVLQHSDQAFEHNIALMPNVNQQFVRIVYNIFSRFKQIESKLALDKELIDPIKLILSYYKKENENGITLFSATKNDNIKDTVLKWNSLSENDLLKPSLYNWQQFDY
jgi:aryl-alcohol dehydrogenase-like predicted oxidoreductase